jgi:hypothetical protein
MGMKRNCLLVAAVVALVMLPVYGRADSHVMQNLRETHWSAAPPFLPPGAKVAVMQGDPGASGFYTIRLWFPANYKIPAHSHPTDEHVTVWSGTLYAGKGDKLDPRGGTALTVGGFALMPVGMNHYAYTKKETTIQLLEWGRWSSPM